ncbi:hypothetical protein [Rhodococcus sp. ACS1]|uniref:hypothetical protein n=1 Tax=Rhodococcus sp. ACS1 TaxID=2028570 RepID=UPI0015CA7D78|nr:hypothetical protein [Rhodococcus sp. ACS1]
MASKPLAEYPKSANGGILEYNYNRSIPMVPNTPFEATLEVVGIERGRSAARFRLNNVDTEATYPMFMTDMLHMVQTATIDAGRIRGTWMAQKRGTNYGVKLVSQ